MTTGEYSPLLRSGSSRTSAAHHHLAIHAHYYDITDIESWPIAGLLVLLDGQAQPVRAELHLYDELQPHVQEAAIRQARMVLQEQYQGGVPVPVRILETFQVREEMQVRLPPVGARPANHAQPFAWRWRPHGMIGAAVLALVALIWVAVSLMTSGREGENNGVAVAPPNESEQSGQVVTVGETTTANSDAAAEEGEAPSAGESANLPVSRNARSDLGIGIRVQAVPGLRVALRSEPGVDSGIVVGELGDGDVATIISGPEYRQGDTDTIVWWYLELSNGTQAWAAANTSQGTLLIPAQ